MKRFILPEKMAFDVEATWQEDKTGVFKTNNTKEIDFGCPVELGGKPGRITPEDLFLASIATCTLTTVLHLAERSRLTFDDLDVEVNGSVVRNDEGILEFENISCKITISGSDEFVLKRLCVLATKNCLIKQNIKNIINYKLIVNGEVVEQLKY